MDERHEDALLERSPSTDTVTEQRRRSANGKALKVTGLTVLACLLLAGQAFTAYFVMKQKGNLQALETGQNNLKKEMSRMLKAAPKIMQTSSNKMPLMMAIDDGSIKQRIPLTRLQSASFQLQKEGSGLVEEGSRVASKSIMASKALLTDFSQDKLEEEAKTPGPSAAVVETKCKIEAKQIKPGFYQPQCDEEGNFKPMQCWHSTGYCWCVDKDGKEIPDTLSRKPIECGNVN